jgi:hypothetical protein
MLRRRRRFLAAAFLSFRDSLDTADTTRFPVAQFGPVDDPGAVRKNAFLAMPVIL